MKLLFFVFGVIVLIAGCTAPAQPPSLPQQENKTQLTCEEYCITLPHVQCVGDWKVSGLYPNCLCTFECVTEETNTTNVTEPPPANVTSPANVTPPAPLPFPTTDKTLTQMLDEGLDKARTDFYRSNSGTYDERTYTWKRYSANITPDEIVFPAPADDVKFDGASISSINASGFVVFNNTQNDIVRAYGLAIFQANNTKLDSYTGSDTFDIDYFPPIIDKELRDCQVYVQDYVFTPEDKLLITYFFKCEKVYNKN